MLTSITPGSGVTLSTLQARVARRRVALDAHRRAAASAAVSSMAREQCRRSPRAACSGGRNTCSVAVARLDAQRGAGSTSCGLRSRSPAVLRRRLPRRALVRAIAQASRGGEADRPAVLGGPRRPAAPRAATPAAGASPAANRRAAGTGARGAAASGCCASAGVAARSGAALERQHVAGRPLPRPLLAAGARGARARRVASGRRCERIDVDRQRCSSCEQLRRRPRRPGST